MITGDHLATARAIGERFGLDGAGLSGAELDALDDEAFERAARETTVFARVAPEHKLRLVRALQRQGEVVAMTGDGVNDAPALRQADIGVAMGAGGTATAREAADLVLTDDDFASIAAAVEEGRRVYDNIQKAIAFVLPTNLGEALIILVAGAALPVLGRRAAAAGPADADPLGQPDRDGDAGAAARRRGARARPDAPPLRARRATPLLGARTAWRTIVAALLMTAAALVVFALERQPSWRGGATADDALAVGQTAAVTAIVLFQAVYLLECRSLRTSLFAMPAGGNPWVWAGIAAVLDAAVRVHLRAAAAGPVRLRAARRLGWALAAVAALTVLPVVEAEKRWGRRAPSSR